MKTALPLLMLVLFASFALADNWFGSALQFGTAADNGTVIQCFDMENASKVLGTALYIDSNPLPFAPTSPYYLTVDPGFDGKVFFKIDGYPVDQNEQQTGENNGISCPVCSTTTHLFNLSVTDADSDGFAKGFPNYPGDDMDCNDNNASINPSINESSDNDAMCNGADDDCDGVIDEGFPDFDSDVVADCVDPDVDGDGVNNGGDYIYGNSANLISNVAGLTFSVNGTDNPNSFDGEGFVRIYDNATNLTLVEFLYNFGNSTVFNLTGVNVSYTSSPGTLVIHGINLASQGKTKTVYIDNTLTSGTICLRDADVASLVVTGDCSNSGAVKVPCNGNNGAYSCAIVESGTRLKVSGLTHSAVAEYSYTAPAPAPVPQSTGGGGGGGSGCVPEFSDWGSCTNGVQTRTVLNSCFVPSSSLTQTCESAPAPASAPQTNTVTPQPTAPTPEPTPEVVEQPPAEETGPTGFAAFTGNAIATFQKNPGASAGFSILLVLVAGFFLYMNLVRPYASPEGMVKKAAKLHKKAESAYILGNRKRSQRLTEKAAELRERAFKK